MIKFKYTTKTKFIDYLFTINELRKSLYSWVLLNCWTFIDFSNYRYIINSQHSLLWPINWNKRTIYKPGKYKFHYWQTLFRSFNQSKFSWQESSYWFLFFIWTAVAYDYRIWNHFILFHCRFFALYYSCYKHNSTCMLYEFQVAYLSQDLK